MFLKHVVKLQMLIINTSAEISELVRVAAEHHSKTEVDSDLLLTIAHKQLDEMKKVTEEITNELKITPSK